MAAPKHVPLVAGSTPRIYASPPRRPTAWFATRPGELRSPGQPQGELRGYQGPDLGYALLLARSLTEGISLAEGERPEDVVAGCAAVAMRRASLHGRAPLPRDVRSAFEIWGFLGDPPRQLVERRRELFEQVASAHHWVERRRIADLVPEELLRDAELDPAEAWRKLSQLLAPA